MSEQTERKRGAGRSASTDAERREALKAQAARESKQPYAAELDDRENERKQREQAGGADRRRGP
jgi:hypothetical protein